MTARRRVFEALGFDPAPGEPGRVEARARQYRRAADQLRSARDAITAVAGRTWDGEAGEAFTRRVGDLSEHLDTATRSMSQAATALNDWQADLSELQRQAWELELTARTAGDGATAEVIEAARRLRQQHDEAAHRVAALLDTARALAPEEPDVCLDAVDDVFAAVGAEAHPGSDLVTDDAIATVSDVLRTASAAVDVADSLTARASEATPGELAAVLSRHWVPRDLGDGAGPLTVALTNAIADGVTDVRPAGEVVAE